MAGRSMIFREMGPLLVTVHATRAPTDAEWSAYIQVARRKVAREHLVALAVTAGGAPNTKQRSVLQELVRDAPVPSAVVTDVVLIRGIVTALGWFNPAIRCFPLHRGAGVLDALRYLGVEGLSMDRAIVEIAEMQRELHASRPET